MNRLAILKILAPGFLPLLVFIIVDTLWGTQAGLVVAVLSGLVEFAIVYFREKIVDRFVLLDTALLVLLGSVSLISHHDIFFLLKPALIEACFCCLLGISAFSRQNILLLLARRYLKHMTWNEAQLGKMRSGLRSLFLLFLAHTLLIVYAAFFASRRFWAFVSGALFYILLGCFFLAEWLKNRAQRKRIPVAHDEEEWFDIVEPDGKVRGRAPRSVCHSGPGYLHPVVHLQIISAANRIFLQKRAAGKEIQPGKWDTAVGGHIRSGETVENALKREAEEELGLTEFKAQLLGRYLWQSEVESELVYMFLARLENVPGLNRAEMDEGQFWRIKKIRAELGSGVFTPNFEFEFDLLLKNFLK